MTARRFDSPTAWRLIESFGIYCVEIEQHRAQRPIRDVIDKEAADDPISDWGERGNAKAQRVHDFDEHARGRLGKSPDDAHTASKSFQVQKTHLHSLAVNHLLGSPGDRNARADRSHLDDVAAWPALEITDVTVVGQNARPLLEVGRGLENGIARSLDED
jgi:hypothetical protein